jgi:hypothetical protein
VSFTQLLVPSDPRARYFLGGLLIAAGVLVGSAAYAQPVLYVSDFTTNFVYQIPAGGGPATTYFSNPPPPTPNGLTGIVFDSLGNLLVSDARNSRVVKVTPQGVGAIYASGFGGAQGLAIDGSNNLYIAAVNDNAVYKVAPTLSQSTFAGGLNGPVGLAYDRTSGSLYVTNHGGTTVSQFNSLGTLLHTYSGFSTPQALALDGAGDLYVSSFNGGSPNGEVQKMRLSDGAILARYSGFANPVGMYFDATSGSVIVGDTTNGTVSSISPLGVVTPYATGVPHPDFMTVNPVPEPSSLFLGAFGGISMGLAAWRRRRNARGQVRC